jgi:nicotinate-nucleotide adenylyltransferase
LLELCVFIAFNRPGKEVEIARKSLSAKDKKRFASHSRIVRMEMPGMDISSTGIRQRVMDGKPILYLVPAEVVAYITKNRLYR